MLESPVKGLGDIDDDDVVVVVVVVVGDRCDRRCCSRVVRFWISFSFRSRSDLAFSSFSFCSFSFFSLSCCSIRLNLIASMIINSSRLRMFETRDRIQRQPSQAPFISTRKQ